MKRILTSLLLTICFCGAVFGQDDADARTKKMLAEAAKNGNALKSQLTVNGNVHVQAVLIPRKDAKRIFGREIAENYAVVEVNIGNKSPDAAFILHGVFIDYENWPLSGSAPEDRGRLRSKNPYQESAFPNEVASEEYRVVRGQLLDAQTDTLRNRFLRYLTWAGSLASAFAFSINEQGIIRGIASANGVGIPGFATAFPDKTIEQLNRVSDFGFRANKIVPKEGSDVIVCFFPIDRFLTPGFRKLFLKSPALFFAPLLMLTDPSVEKDIKPIMDAVLAESGVDLPKMRAKLPCFMKIRKGDPQVTGYDICLANLGLERTPEGKFKVKNEADFRVFMALEFIGDVSLNRVTITIDGVMTVESTTIAARTDEIRFDRVSKCGDDNLCFWANTQADSGVRTGTIHGAFLTGGSVIIDGANDLGITELKTISDGSSDQTLRFSFKLTKPVAPEKTLQFTISKPKPGATGQTLKSTVHLYPVSYGLKVATITGVEVDKPEKGQLKIKGTGFYDIQPDFPLVVTVTKPDGTSEPVKPISVKSSEIVIAMPAAPTGCWTGTIAIKGVEASAGDACFCFLVMPAPKLDSAKRQDNKIIALGSDLIDPSRSVCRGPKLTFQLAKDGGTPKTAIVESLTEKEATLTLPAEAKEGSWKLKVLLGGEVKAEKPVQ